jgi:hypothetical protein
MLVFVPVVGPGAELLIIAVVFESIVTSFYKFILADIVIVFQLDLLLLVRYSWAQQQSLVNRYSGMGDEVYLCFDTLISLRSWV